MVPSDVLYIGPNVFCIARRACAAIALAFLFWGNMAFAQNSSEDAPRPIVAPKQVAPGEQVSTTQLEADANDLAQSSNVSTSLDASSLGSTAEVKQSKRILWIFPNYRAVSADTQLPPLSLKDKFCWLRRIASTIRLSFPQGCLQVSAKRISLIGSLGKAQNAMAATTGMRWRTRLLETI
jgi:hypothetical protein